MITSESEESSLFISVDGDHLSLVGHDLLSLPPDVGTQYGDQIKELDLSYNSIIKLDNLEHFNDLHTLVVDNNRLESFQSFPYFEKLKTLSVNNNNITDLKEFIDCVKDKLPNLTYMSMLKNPACPSELIVGRDTDDYQRYRYYVLFRLKGLRFLDSTPVSETERREAIRIGHLSLPARPDPSQYKRPSTVADEEIPKELSPELKQEGIGKASFGVSNYVYYGRQSEGNRFIVNDDL